MFLTTILCNYKLLKVFFFLLWNMFFLLQKSFKIQVNIYQIKEVMFFSKTYFFEDFLKDLSAICAL